VHGRDTRFRRTVALVLASAVVPGTAHLATGHRRAGRAILAVFLLVLLAVAGVALAALLAPESVATIAVRPNWLAALRWTILAVGLAWLVMLLSSAVVAEGASSGVLRKLAALGLVGVLAAAFAVPTVTASHYAAVQQGVINDVFGGGLSGAGSPKEQLPRSAALRDGRLNVLLVGGDSAPYENREGLRTDTVILASVDTDTGRTVLFTLPRNMGRIPFPPGSPMDREWPRGFRCASGCYLNAIYDWAVAHPNLFPGDDDPGMTAVRDGVSAALGLDVEYHVLVNLEGFEKLIDALGGVRIRVERRLPIGGLDADGDLVEPSGYIPRGLQTLDGYQALWYARSRSDSSDYDRIRRQRCLLGGLARQAEPINVLRNFQEVARSTQDAVATDIPQDVLPELVRLAFSVKEQPITSLAFVPPTVPDTARPDFDAMRQLVRSTLAAAEQRTPDDSPAPRPAPSAGSPAATPSVTSSPESDDSAGQDGGTATPDPFQSFRDRFLDSPGSPSASPTTDPRGQPVELADVCRYE